MTAREKGSDSTQARAAEADRRVVATATANVDDILDAIDLPTIVIGHDRRVARFNRAAAETLGLTRSDIDRAPCNILALSRVKGLDHLCEQVMAEAVPARRDFQIGDRWFLLHLSPCTASDRQVRGAVLTFANVTAFRASLGQAIYEREYTKTILNTVIDPLVVLDADLAIQTANRAFYEWFQVSREQAQAVPLRDLRKDDWGESDLWSSLKACLSDNSEFRTIELELDSPTSGRRTVLLDARRLARDESTLLLLAFRDITQRKQAEQAQRESEGRFRALFESMDEGYCVIEMVFDDKNQPIDYRFLETNPVFEKQTGIKEAKGRLMREIAPDHEQHWFDIYGRIALTGETIRFENPAAALERHYDVCAFRVGKPEQHRVGIIFNDITQRKKFERERERMFAQEERLRKEAETAASAKDRFLAVLSHELRTPLTPVVMAVAAIEHDPDLPFALREDLAMIRRNIELETRLIDDLLDLNRVTSGKMRLQIQPTHAHPVLKQAVRNCISDTLAKKLDVRPRFQAKNDLVNADPARLQQVFWNLLRNAAKFTPEGGEILIRTESAGGRFYVTVSDTGIGISSEFLPRIFDAFEQGDIRTTRQFGGLGLGLAICRAVIDMHGGTIRAQSDGIGKGATFTIELPVAVVPKSPEHADQVIGRNSPCGLVRVLLVEDHPDTLNVLAKSLGASGYAVQTASSIAAGLHLADNHPFDVVVSDLGLPDGTGYELMKKINERHGIKGIALSGYGMEEDQRQSREAGFLEHVVKPANLDQLDAAIRRVAHGAAQYVPKG